MTDEFDKNWDKLFRKLQKELGYGSIGIEQADKELANAKEIPFNNEEIALGLSRQREITSGKSYGVKPPLMDWVPQFDQDAMKNEVAHLNRNEGERDEEAEELVKKLREEALSDDDDQ